MKSFYDILRIPRPENSFFYGKSFFCGFSGGADSTAALLLIKRESEILRFSVEAVHYEHGFRGQESLDDAEHCIHLCEEIGVPVRVIPLNVPANKLPGESDESAARRLRMIQWQKIYTENSNSIFVLGHNADDRLENLFLRLLRGSNVSGLTSLRQLSAVDGMTFYRPLLTCPRVQIEKFLKDLCISWRTDSTNLENAYRRNFIRHEILPRLVSGISSGTEGLWSSIRVLQDDAEYLENAARTAFDGILSDSVRWHDLPKAVFCRVLRLFLTHEFGREYIPDRHLIDRCFDLIHQSGTGAEIPVSGYPGFYLKYSSGNRLHLIKKENLPSVFWNWKKKPELKFGRWTISAEECSSMPEIKDHFSAVFSAKDLPEMLQIRSRAPGDTMIPFGRHSFCSVKKLVSDVPEIEGLRDFPLMCFPGGVLWAVGVRRSAILPADSGTLILFKASCESSRS